MASPRQNRLETPLCQSHKHRGRKPQAASKEANGALRPRGLIPRSANTRLQRRRQRSLAGALISADERRCRRRAGDAGRSRACACVCAESINSLADAPRTRRESERRDQKQRALLRPRPWRRSFLQDFKRNAIAAPPIAAPLGLANAGGRGGGAGKRKGKNENGTCTIESK